MNYESFSNAGKKQCRKIPALFVENCILLFIFLDSPPQEVYLREYYRAHPVPVFHMG
jgi:hypothetical protein